MEKLENMFSLTTQGNQVQLFFCIYVQTCYGVSLWESRAEDKVRTQLIWYFYHKAVLGPMPIAKEKKYLLTMINRATRWLEVVPSNDVTAQFATEVLYETCFARFGIPKNTTTDQGLVIQVKII